MKYKVLIIDEIGFSILVRRLTSKGKVTDSKREKTGNKNRQSVPVILSNLKKWSKLYI